MGPWRLLRSGAGPPGFNLALDEVLLRQDPFRPTLRLYGWRPAALSLGHFQPLEPFVEPAREQGLCIVRRPTGGGAIHHDHEITFALAATPGALGFPAGVDEAYELVHGAVAEALGRLGAPLVGRGGEATRSVRPREATLCFQDVTYHDLVDEHGRKVVGSAQRRTGGRVLHHGSIPLRRPALSPDCGSLDDAAGRDVSWTEVADELVRSLGGVLEGGWQELALTRDEEQRAQALARARYPDLARAIED